MSITENAISIIKRATDLVEKGYDKYKAYLLAAQEVLNKGDEN